MAGQRRGGPWLPMSGRGVNAGRAGTTEGARARLCRCVCVRACARLCARASQPASVGVGVRVRACARPPLRAPRSPAGRRGSLRAPLSRGRRARRCARPAARRLCAPLRPAPRVCACARRSSRLRRQGPRHGCSAPITSQKRCFLRPGGRFWPRFPALGPAAPWRKRNSRAGSEGNGVGGEGGREARTRYPSSYFF